MPSWRAISMAMAVSSPVIILTAMPLALTASIVALESSRGGSNIGRMPSSDQVVPPSSERATASARLPLAARAATVSLTLAAMSAGGLARSTIACGAPLATVSVLPCASLTVASVRLVTGSNGVKLVWRVGLGGVRVLQALDHAGVDRVVVLEPRGERAGEHHVLAGRWRRTGSGRRASAGSWSACRSCRCRGCRRRPSPRSRRGARRSPSASRGASAPSAMVIEKTAGIATGIEATSRTSTNCRMSSASSQRQSSAMTMSR